MAETISLPKWGLTMEEGTIIELEIQVGDPVELGDVLALIETEKVEVDLPSPVGGVITEILVEVGDTVPVGAALMLVETNPA